MPIYEFKCLDCNNVFELLLINNDETHEMVCPKCQGENFERIMSATSYAMGPSSGESLGPKSQTRTCSTGSCTTIDLPGYSR